MRTYRELFRTPEFTPLFLTSAAQIAAQTVSGLALGTLVYAATGSPLLSALAMFGPSLAQVVGATTLLSAADRLPPRAAMTGLALLFGLGTAVQAMPGLPLWASFAVLLGLGMVAVAGRRGAVRAAQRDPRQGRLSARPFGAQHVRGRHADRRLRRSAACWWPPCPRAARCSSAPGCISCAAAVARFGLTRRAPRAEGRPSIAQTWRNNARLWSSGRAATSTSPCGCPTA